MRRIVYLIIAFLSLAIGIGCLHYIPYFIPAEEQNDIVIKHHNDDTIRIAYIGDSWAVGHQKVKCVIDSLVGFAIGKTVLIRSAGISGLTSKNVYYGIFRNDSMKDVIEWGPDFCFVVAGINDSDRKIGKGYYKQNMRLIIDFLLQNQIIPIILEIPSYDIRLSFKRRSRKIKLLYIASMLLTRSKMDCINDYRQEYSNLLIEQGWEKKVISIWSKDWNPDGFRDIRGLYDEGLMHLNEKGYLVLDSCISNKVVKYLIGSANNRYH